MFDKRVLCTAFANNFKLLLIRFFFAFYLIYTIKLYLKEKCMKDKKSFREQIDFYVQCSVLSDRPLPDKEFLYIGICEKLYIYLPHIKRRINRAHVFGKRMFSSLI